MEPASVAGLDREEAQVIEEHAFDALGELFDCIGGQSPVPA
jgi:hypothetical protein